ncbi:MAG: alpha/beta hydrolase [Planctomycetaceae bacterium]|nr:alpha/beta hydrolase [Planctomycetaceae bacterium]MBP61928.1 alpha/beta hydrolase [Planctomycetaceae bacterium]
MGKVRVSTGIEIYYERTGSGPTLLLIMGTGLDHSCWNAQLEAYRDEFDCIAFDNRGTGKTSVSGESLTTGSMADDAAALLEALGVSRAHISGLSLGSCIAQELAIRRPDLVETLQLHGTWASAHGYAARKFRAQIQLLESLDLRAFYEINVLWFITPRWMEQHPDRVARQIDTIVAAAPPVEVLKQQYLADLNHDTLDRLDQIQVPTLVTVGSFDVALPPMYSREVAAGISLAELVVFDDGGHLHNIEQPDEFNQVTLEFLRTHAVGDLR